MLVLQYRSPHEWRSLAPYDVADAARMQDAAARMSEVTGLRWRVLGSDGRLLTFYDRGRWHLAGEADTAPSGWAGLETGPEADTVPTR